MQTRRPRKRKVTTNKTHVGTLQARVPLDQLEYLMHVAVTQGTTMSGAVRYAIANSFARDIENGKAEGTGVGLRLEPVDELDQAEDD